MVSTLYQSKALAKLDIEEQSQVTSSFKAFDKNKDGTMEAAEFKTLLKQLGRDDVTDAQIGSLFSKFDKNKDGSLSFDEYVQMYVEIHGKKGVQVADKDVKGQSGKQISGAGGHHTFLDEERNTAARHFNHVLEGDEFVGDRFPIEPESDSLFDVMHDGMVLIRLCNIAEPGSVDMRVVNTKDMNIFKVKENLNYALNVAKSGVGLKLIGINQTDFLEKKPHLMLAVCLQISRKIQVKKIALRDCPEIMRLAQGDETIQDLMKLPPEDILIRWINFHLRAAGQTRQVTNLGKDLQDSQAMFYVLNQLDKQKCPLSHINDADQVERANQMINNSKAIDVAEMVTAKDWVKGNSKVNTIFVAEVFNTRHGLEEVTQEEIDKAGLIDDDIAGSREERQFRLWINSLEIEDVYINNLFEDVRDGQVLLKVIHKINPNVVEWNRVEKNPNNEFKKKINCQVAFDACNDKRMNVKTIGIGAGDISDGNKKMILAIVWQLMRTHYLQIIGGKTDQDILNWANTSVPDMKIGSFRDKALSDGIFLIKLCSSIEPRIINWDIVKNPAESDEDKQLNSKYAISIARKLGAIIFLVWDDVIECNQKMMLIFMSSLWDIYNQKKQ